MNIFQIEPIFFNIIFKRKNFLKYQEYYSSLLQLKPYKIVEAGGLAQKKTIQPTFSIGKASQGHYSFLVVDFRFGLFMEDGFMPFPSDQSLCVQ